MKSDTTKRNIEATKRAERWADLIVPRSSPKWQHFVALAHSQLIQFGEWVEQDRRDNAKQKPIKLDMLNPLSFSLPDEPSLFDWANL